MSKINWKKVWKKVRKNLYPHWQKAAPYTMLFVSVIVTIQISNIVAPQFTAHTATLVILVTTTIFSSYKWYKEADTVRRMKSGSERARLELTYEKARHQEIEKIQSQFIAGSQKQTHKKQESVPCFDGERQEY